MYKVIKYFTDLEDNSHPYNVGDVFPRDGLEVSEQRFAILSSTNNKRGMPLIKEVEVVKVKPVKKVEEQPKVETKAEDVEEKPVKRGRKKKEN